MVGTDRQLIGPRANNRQVVGNRQFAREKRDGAPHQVRSEGDCVCAGIRVSKCNRPNQCELACVRKASLYSDCVLFDGALQDVPGTGFKSLFDTIDETVTVMGISKKTCLDTLKKGIPDTETLDYSGRWYYHVPSSTLGRTYRPLGDVYIAKLHERGPSFRVDVKGNPKFSRLAHYSNYLFCLGYPYPLLEIHKATTLRDKITYFQLKLQEAMTRKGLEREYLSGIYHLEKEREEFHQVIDGLT